jgi:carbon monoxide dehydrogenase subunit G
MQVTIDKEYPVAASSQTAWRLLTNIPELTSCMPGAQITEEIDATHFKGAVKVKVGPAVAAFAGTIEVLAVDAATGTLRMLGKGADKGGSSASMELTAILVSVADGQSTLHGKADVIVNGKFAQFGGRMMTSVSDVILGQFAAAFSQKAQGMQGANGSAGAPGEVIAPAEAPGVTAASTQAANDDRPPAAAPTPAAATELNALGLLWALLRNWFAGLFGRKT